MADICAGISFINKQPHLHAGFYLSAISAPSTALGGSPLAGLDEVLRDSSREHAFPHRSCACAGLAAP